MIWVSWVQPLPPMNNISQFDNPYLPPETLSTSPPPLPGAPGAEDVRREHAYTESTVGTMGVLYYIAGTFVALGGLIQLLNVLIAHTPDVSKEVMTCAFVLVFGVALFALGREARKFNSSARTGIIIISALGLLAFPIGTLINGYILCTLSSKKGRMVFSPEYKAIMATTARPKVKTSAAVWIVLAVALFIIAVAGYLIIA